MKAKADVLAEVGSMLRDVFEAKANGKAYNRIARAHGYVDGYMRALIELGFASKEELVEIVNSERERSSPSMHTLAELAAHAHAAA
jgi:hypothetical protein